MKKARRSLMALGVAVFSLSAILTGRMKEKPVLAQLNCQKAVPITSRWADDTHIFSSFDDQKALSVDASYGFKMHETNQTKTTITKGKETKKLPDISMPAFLKRYIWFDTSENTSGNIQIKKTNMEIYQCDKDGNHGKWQTFDLVMTITGIEKYKNKDGYVAIGNDLSGCSYIGIEEMTMKSQFFKAGTNIPVTIKSNMTLQDIDTHQYIGVKADDIHGEYVSKNTKLSYKKDGNMSIYYADFEENYDSEDFTCAGFTFASDTFEYTFGRIRDDGPTNQEQYVGYGQNMIKFDPPSPKKEIITSKGESTEHYTCPDLSKTWTYEVSQMIAGDIPKAHYFTGFAFEDNVEECQKILDIKVYGDEQDVSDEFDISQNGNLVKARLKNPGDPQFYKRGIYVLKIKTKMNIMKDATKEQLTELRNLWEKHGHYNENKTVLTEKNTAKTIIDGKNAMTNEVKIDIDLPKRDENNPGLMITKETKQYEYQAKDEITYKVTVKNENEKAGTAYFKVQDRSLAGVSKVSLKDVKVFGIPEDSYILQEEGNSWILKSKDDYVLPYENKIEIVYTVKTSVAANGQLIDNEASAWAAGIPETKDQAQVYINSPKNDVIKSAPAQIYKKGDHVAYKAVITNPNQGTFMRDVKIEDEIKAEGIRIIPGTLSIMADGKNIISKCQVDFDKNERAYTIQTPIALKNGEIPVYSSECGKRDENYKNLWMTDKIEISYQAVIEQDGLEGKDIKNVLKVPATRNSNQELILEDTEIPSGSGMAEEVIKIKAPKLQILKQSDKKIYSVGETGTYKLHIIQGKEGVTARNIMVTDEFEKEGMKISEIQVLYNEQDITDECKIEAGAGQFEIETGKDLGDSDFIDILYKVLFEKRIDGAIKNTAVVQSDNTEAAKDENTVVVKPPMLKIEKTSGRKIYKEGQTGAYKIRVTQKNEGMTAHKVVIEDAFEKKGMEIGMIRVKINGEDITNQCEISKDDSGRKFKIMTGRDLSDQDEMIVSYDTAFPAMIEGDIKNTAYAYGEDADKVKDDLIVTMEKNTPELLITKKSDKTVYKSGGVCEYQIFVSQIVKDALAKNVVIEDKIDHKYAKIIKGSVHVFSPDESDITSKCRIVLAQNSFRIETRENLADDQKIKVLYQVKLSNRNWKDQTVKNIAKAKADNAKEVSAVREIKVKNQKTVENKTYTKKTGKDSQNTGTSSGVSTGDKSDFRWIFIMVAAAFSGVFILYRKRKH